MASVIATSTPAIFSPRPYVWPCEKDMFSPTEVFIPQASISLFEKTKSDAAGVGIMDRSWYYAGGTYGEEEEEEYGGGVNVDVDVDMDMDTDVEEAEESGIEIEVCVVCVVWNAIIS